MKTAFVFASLSPAKRLQVGATAVKRNRIISCGYNALPEHIDGSCELEDNTTDPRVRHAEINCLNGLRNSNETIEGSIFFCTHSACLQCAIELVDSRISHFYYVHEYRSPDGIKYLEKHGIPVTKLDKELFK